MPDCKHCSENDQIFGGPLGLPPGKTVTEKGGILLAIDVVAIPLCLIAMLLALALVQSWGRSIPLWMLLIAAWIAGVLLTLRGIVGLIQDILAPASITGSSLDVIYLYPYDLWFLPGGLLFVVLALKAHQQPKHDSGYKSGHS